MSQSTDGGLRSWVTRRRVLGGAIGLGAAGLVHDGLSAPTSSPVATPCSNIVITFSKPVARIELHDATGHVSDAQMDKLVSVMNTQITRDFVPIWGAEAIVSKTVSGTPTPAGTWRVRIKAGATGSGHSVDHSGFPLFDDVPWADVNYASLDTLAHTVSHECLEMLANPFNTRYHLLDAPPKAANQGKVLYEHEICEPCRPLNPHYQIDCWTVSDFVLPAYFDPFPSKDPHQRYSFVGGLTQQRTPLPLGSQDYLLVTTGDLWTYEYTTSGLKARKK